MTGQLAYLIAEQRIADLHKTADHRRLARAAKNLRHQASDRGLISRIQTGISAPLRLIDWRLAPPLPNRSAPPSSQRDRDQRSTHRRHPMTSICAKPRGIAIAVAIAAIALAIGAFAAPAASAQLFDPNPPNGFSVNPSTRYATPVPTPQTHTTAPRPEVHANPDEQATLPGPVPPPILHQARGSRLAAIDRAKEQALANHVPPTGRYSSADLNGYAAAAHPSAAASPAPKSPNNGFDWGDAAIGAGITAAIALALTAGSLAVRQRRQPRYQ
jgi:hypothetical protein